MLRTTGGSAHLVYTDSRALVTLYSCEHVLLQAVEHAGMLAAPM